MLGSEASCSACGKLNCNPQDLPGSDKNVINREKLIRLTAGFLLLAAALFLIREGAMQVTAYLAAYLVLGCDVIYKAVKRISQHRLFTEHLLMTIATAGALIIGEYPEAVAVMLFYQTGDFFQDLAVDRSRRSIAALQNLRPDKARLVSGQIISEIDPADVKTGDHLLILPGDRVPADSHVIEGRSDMDTSAMTGESMPRAVSENDTVQAGFINGNGRIIVQADKPAADSAVSRVLDLVNSAAEKKAPAEHFITKFAAVYTPAVVALALLLAVVPPIVLNQPFTDWVYRALILLVISCPCALVLSVPLTYFAGLGSASRAGLLVKGGRYLEKMAEADVLVLDKTGTLTSGDFKVSKIESPDWPETKLLRTAALMEANSRHPIAKSIVSAWQAESGEQSDLQLASDMKDLPGLGMKATVDGMHMLLGSRRLLELQKIDCPMPAKGDNRSESVLYLAADGQYKGRIFLADSPRPEAADSLKALRKNGLKEFVLLSGDHEAVVQDIADQLKIEHAVGNAFPDQKVALIESLKKKKRQVIVFLGDGMNDAPALAMADVGIAMGTGSDAAIQNADAVLMSGRLDRLPKGFEIARKTARIVRQNIFLALGLKLLIMILAVFGLSGIWQAIFADVGVSLLAVLNALRLLKK